MKMKKSKAQSILEYVVLLGIIAVALSAMQLYFKRGIQSTIKAAADEIGSQQKGAADFDYKYEWKIKGDSAVTSTSSGTSTTNRQTGGAVAYGRDDTSTQEGILSFGVWQEKD